MLAGAKRFAHKVAAARAFAGGWRPLIGRGVRVIATQGPVALLHKVRVITTGQDNLAPVVKKGGVSGPPITVRYHESAADASHRLRPLASPGSSIVDGPRISILTPVYNVPIVFLTRAVNSVLNQSYGNWELCLVDDGSTDPDVAVVLKKFAAGDPRIKVSIQAKNAGIAAATNVALKMASGEYVGLLDNDDMLTFDALESMARAIIDNGNPDLVYSDEFKIDENEVADELFPKPDWSPLALLNQMYTGHFSVYKKTVVEAVGGFRSQYDFSQDYDLALRVADVDRNVVHVEEYLYAWRKIAGSAAMGGKQDARVSNVAALQSASDRRGWGGEAVPLPNANRLVRKDVGAHLVSIVVPSDDENNIRTTIDSILEKTVYDAFEIIIVTNSGIVDKLEGQVNSRVRFCRYDKRYNFSDKCNAGAAIAEGSYIVFFNDDVRVISPDWIEAILECATLPGVGVVGTKLLYENETIQHAGMLTGVRRLVGTAFHSFPRNTSAHFNFAQHVREVSLICGACFAMPKTVFDQVGGFNAADAPISHSDVDLCFRVRDAGYKCVYTPHAELFHIGHVSIAKEEAKQKDNVKPKDKADIFLMRRWGSKLERDPYFPKAMRDILYIDSQETFTYYPGSVYPPRQGRDVLILSHDLSGSGAPKIVYDMAQWFATQGDFVVVCSPTDGPYRRRLLELGVHVVVDPLLFHNHKWTEDFGRNFDLVVANTVVCWPAVAQLSPSVDVFWYIHEAELIEELVARHPALATTLSSAKAVWAGSDFSAKILRDLGVKAEVMPYGVDQPPPSSPPGRKVVIGLFGSYEPRKGQDLGVLGMLQIPEALRRKAELRVFGRSLDDHFRRAVVELAMGDPAIMVRGEITYDQYITELHDVDIVLVPSRNDTLPLVSLDALALGKVLVCSSTTGSAEYIEHDVSGFVLEHNAPREIGEVLSRLIANETLRGSVGEAGRAVFEKTFTRSAFDARFAKALGVAKREAKPRKKVSA